MYYSMVKCLSGCHMISRVQGVGTVVKNRKQKIYDRQTFLVNRIINLMLFGIYMIDVIIKDDDDNNN